MPVFYGVGGAFRKAVSIFTGVAGQWRPVKTIWVGVAGQWRIKFADDASAIALTGSAIAGVSVIPDVAVASVTLAADGTVAGSYWDRQTAELKAVQLSPWATPTPQNPGLYEVRAVHKSGVEPMIGLINTWLPLNTAQTWQVSTTASVTPESYSSIIELEIRRIGTTVVLAKAAFSLVTRSVDPLGRGDGGIDVSPWYIP